jgi:hypothetical protein
MPERPVTSHPGFERVAARYRNAIRRRDDAAIDRVRADLDRLTREVWQAETWRVAADKAFTTPVQTQERQTMATWDEAKNEARRAARRGPPSVFIKLKEDGARIEVAIVGEPHVYWRRSFDEPSRDTKRFLINVFVRGQGMRIFEATVATFWALATLSDTIDFAKQLVVIERIGKPRDPETRYSTFPGSLITADLAAQIAAAQRHDLPSIATKRAETVAVPSTPDSVPAAKDPTTDRRTA